MTYREFAEKYLDPEVKEKFIRNTINLNYPGFDNEGNKSDSDKLTPNQCSWFVSTAFTWRNSPEGRDFWTEINESFKEEKTYTVHFLTPYCSWEVKAKNEKEAIEQCEMSLEHDGYGEFVAIEQPDYRL